MSLQKTTSIIYPIEPWTISEPSFTQNNNKRNETIFTVGNGYIGMRGFAEETTPGLADYSYPGIFINGFYETAPIRYGEIAYGYAKNHQTILNVPNTLKIAILADGEPVNLCSGRIDHYFRRLHLKEGYMERGYRWTSPKTGKSLNLCFTRLVSLARKNIAYDRLTIHQPENKAAIKLISSIDLDVHNRENKNDPRTGSHFLHNVYINKQAIKDSEWLAALEDTYASELSICSAMSHSTKGEKAAMDTLLAETFDFGRSDVDLTKYIGYTTGPQHNRQTLPEMLRRELLFARDAGPETLMDEQKDFLQHFWRLANVEVAGDRALEQAVHFNCFQLLQSAGRDGKTNIAAKGITGEGYEGHYFWDSEIFIFPFFLFTYPDIARQFLDYRYSILDQARKRAKEMGCRGALFPWRTINGEEASAYYPAGTAQIHINADIMYALKQYVTVTGDEDFLREKGMEMLIETSRFYLSYGSFVPNRGFVLDCVTGPDEYTAMVNNNAYTNLMVKDELEYLTAHLHPDNLKKYGVNEKEYRLFKKAADEMYLYRQGDLIGQDDSFLSKGKWDFDTTTPDQYPLLLHFHPLTIYRRQVLKQADLVLAMILQGERFTRKEKEINYDYYEPLTTHDSSLSTSAHAILAAELGRIGPAVAFFYRTARADLDDYQHNIADGVHTAAMAGSWLTIVFGFAGLRIKNGQLHFHPLLPRQWKSYRFGLRFNNTELKISVTETGTAYRRIAGDPLTVYDNGECRTV